MAKVKLVSLQGMRNTPVHYPVVGVVHHDSNGVIEVEEDQVDELLKVRHEFLMHEDEYKKLMLKKASAKVSKEKVEVPQTKATMDLEAEEENDQNKENEKDTIDEGEFRARIQGESKIALQAMCEDFNYPEEDYKNLRKPELIDYIIRKTIEVK